MFVDTSRGKGLDYSAFIVVDVSQVPYRTVATFRNNELPSMIYPTVVEQTAKYYNGAQVLIETNDVGQQVADILRDDLGGKSVAVKWYYSHSIQADPYQRDRLEAAIQSGSPSDRFLWPIDIVSEPGIPGFGYVMPLRELRYKGFLYCNGKSSNLCSNRYYCFVCYDYLSYYSRYDIYGRNNRCNSLPNRNYTTTSTIYSCSIS